MPVDPVVEVRRLLHTNYNCSELDRLERFYTKALSMKSVMRSAQDDMPGRPFGVNALCAHRTSFLYDHRGPRRASSLELAQWIQPRTCGSVYPNRWDHGLHSIGFAVPDVDAVVRSTLDNGGEVVVQRPCAAILRDPEGLPIEIFQSDRTGPEQSHIRIVVADLRATVDWWARLGFALTQVDVEQLELWLEDSRYSVKETASMVATDDDTLSLIFEVWDAPAPWGPTYAAPFHQGLYRMAMAVDGVEQSWVALKKAGIAVQQPFTFSLPGTPITDGLTILFIRDPNGILVELVERPRNHFNNCA